MILTEIVVIQRLNAGRKKNWQLRITSAFLEWPKEMPSRKYNKKDCIEALSKVKVVLKDEDEDERVRRRMEQARTEDEGALASLIDELFENASRNASDGPRSAPIDLNVSQTGEDIANIGASIEEHD